MEKRFLEQCLEAGLSLPQIGELTGRPPGTVGYWVAKHGLEANGKDKFTKKGPVDRDRLKELVDAGLTLDRISEQLGIPKNRVRYWVKKHGLGPTGAVRRTEAIREARAEGAGEIQLECPTHGLTPYWIGSTAVRCRKCNSAGVARRRRVVKEMLVAEAGGRCRICGFDRSSVALEFHHLNPSEKSFGLSAAGITRSLEASRAEAAKCVLLCANCHAMVEAGLAEVPVQ